MTYTRYTDPKVRVEEDYVVTSDGVTLRMIDFVPPCDTPERPMVVFVPGWISLIDGWKDVLQRLTPRYRTLYVETREKASARLPRRPARVDFSMPRMSRDIGEVLERKVAPERASCLAGSSLGATVILDYLSGDARRQPGVAILIAPICELIYPFWLPLLIRPVPPFLYTATKPMLKWYLRDIRLDKHKEPEQVKKYAETLDAAEPGRLKANAFAIRDYSLWEKLPGITSPVLIVGARSDTLHDVDIVSRMARLIPDAETEIMSSNRETHSARMGDLIAHRTNRLHTI
ncbi:MAG: alpha/beta hydrolase [Syntrophales bacterium]|jgi:pimeloyl-ACP methyl ester carboxylesterase|nr:alpha/beta hydrolase [Syntrophales bacterium]